MIEPISETILNGMVIGIMCGVIYEISKKICFIIWSCAVLLLIIIFFAGTTEISNVWEVGNWIAILISVNLSFLIGSFGVKFFKEEFMK